MNSPAPQQVDNWRLVSIKDHAKFYRLHMHSSLFDIEFLSKFPLVDFPWSRERNWIFYQLLNWLENTKVFRSVLLKPITSTCFFLNAHSVACKGITGIPSSDITVEFQFQNKKSHFKTESALGGRSHWNHTCSFLSARNFVLEVITCYGISWRHESAFLSTYFHQKYHHTLL